MKLFPRPSIPAKQTELAGVELNLSHGSADVPAPDACQLAVLGLLRQSYASGHEAPLLQAATGFGKTIVIAGIASDHRVNGQKVLIVVHRKHLLQQTLRKFAEAGEKASAICPDIAPDYDNLIQVGSIETLTRRLGELPEYDLIVFDEAHHCSALQWKGLIRAQPQAKILGVTATPCRLDGQGLGVSAGGCFDDLILAPDVEELIALGRLSPVRCFVPRRRRLDLNSVPTIAGDFDRAGLERAVKRITSSGDPLREYRRRADHQPAIVFCVSIAHANEVAARFRDAGYRAVAVSGKTRAVDRDTAFNGLVTGRTEVLCSCDLISEGFDVPAVSCVILLRVRSQFSTWRIGRAPGFLGG